MTNREIEGLLKRTGQLLELHGANPFKSRAYDRASRSIRASAVDVAARVGAGDEIGIDGIGAGLAAEIREFVEKGTSSELEDLLERTPRGILDILSIRGLGAKKVRAIWEGLGVESLEGLEAAARDGSIAGLKGFGAKSAENILAGIAAFRESEGKFRLNTATERAEEIGTLLDGSSTVERWSETGRLRRRCEIMTSIDFLVIADLDALATDLSEDDRTSDLTVAADRLTGRFEGIPIRLFSADANTWGTRLLTTTGSSDFSLIFGMTVDEKGGVLTASGVRIGDAEPVAADESNLFDAVGLPVIPPELREGIDETSRASRGELPSLIELDHMQGVLHVHSTWSDGRHTIEEMAEGVRERGYRYLLICDHSKAAFYANGLDEARLAEQGTEIDRINERYDPTEFRLLKGVECDIMADGSLDLADDALALLDAVVISVHSSFTLPIEAQTERICRAMSNPHATILAHPTGRLLLTRKGYEVDMRTVIETAAETGTIVELNANPYRLDVDWRLLRYAKKLGLPIAINPDAHAVEQIDFIRYGIDMARKGGLEPADVINTLDAASFLEAVARMRADASTT